MNNWLASWKSTASGILNFVAITGAALTTYLSQNPTMTASRNVIGALSLAVMLSNVWLHMITQDADKVVATVPGGEVRVVSAHPVPDNPKDKAVVPPASSNTGGKK